MAMHRPMIKGTTEILEKARESDTIFNGCPSCQHDLVLKQLRTWGTVFMIPLAPRKKIRFVYECSQCAETFDPAFRKSLVNRSKYLQLTEDDLLQMQDSFSLLILASILAADGQLSTTEKNLLYTFISRLDSDTRLHLSQVSHFSEEAPTQEKVWEQLDLFRDCFRDALRKEALDAVTCFLQQQELGMQEKKLLYLYERHWN